jgi:hypothetical protein
VAGGETSSSFGGKNSAGWNSEREEEFRKWLKDRPAVIQVAATEYPPTRCYRSRTNAGHYVILGYGEPQAGGGVTVQVLHGRDSYGAGHAVFGVPVSDLVPCGCDSWEEASAEELASAVTRFLAILRPPSSGSIH